MADLPQASVVIVSRQRPQALRLCLMALAQQDHPFFEVIVVADPAGQAAVQATGLAISCIGFDTPNISAARNLGLARAAAPVIAFIDDDAVAEPTWLSRLVAPFADPRVTQATGFVRARNGISFQWKASVVGRDGCDTPLEVPEAEVSLHAALPGRAVKTPGCTCAFRTEALRRAGGFDPAFQFYLEDADVNLRLAAGGGLTAVVPLAQVHHHFAAGPHRRPDRVPRSLHQIAASTAVFLRRHGAAPLPAAPPADLVARERARALNHMIAGRIEPRDVGALMASLAAGWADGLSRPLSPLDPLMPLASGPALPLPRTGPRPGLVLSGPPWRRAALLRQAEQARAEGRIVTVLCLGPGPARHWHWFMPQGVWWQEGGVAGKSVREAKRPRGRRFARRVADEVQRLALLRPV
jgi:GT2 family glycosyltransferase